MDNHGSLKVVLIALIGNVIIAVSKFVVFLFTGSVALMAEGIHSVADCGNQILLLVGAKRSKRTESERHSFGYGKEEYFWALQVAVLLFFVGALFSIYEGVHKVFHPEEIHNYLLVLGLLGFAILIESFSFRTAYKEIKAKADGKILNFLKETSDVNIIIIFLEDFAALISLAIALVGITLAYFVNPIFDGFASIGIGTILTVVAVFLMNELRKLIIGESVDRPTTNNIKGIVRQSPIVVHINNMRSMMIGHNQSLVVISVNVDDFVQAHIVESELEQLKIQILKQYPQIKYLYIDVHDNAK